MPAIALPATASGERPSLRMAAIRGLVGLLQGLLLYLLYLIAEEVPDSLSLPLPLVHVYTPAMLIALLLPLIFNVGAGTLSASRNLKWSLLAALILYCLGAYDAWRQGDAAGIAAAYGAYMPGASLLGMAFVGFFVAQVLVQAGAAGNRPIARYADYFELTWRLAGQAQFCLLIVVALWLFAWLGSELFGLVGLQPSATMPHFLLFAIPFTTGGLALALHISAVRPHLILGLQTLTLQLLCWTLPLTTLLVAAFLYILPWAGLSALWAFDHRGWGLLGAIMVLLLLINAAVQDARADRALHPLLNWSARVAALCVLPLALIAAYAMEQRVAEYGLSIARVRGTACIALALCYGAGYAWAGLSGAGWMQRLVRVNGFNAFALLAVLISLSSPLADPARLSVNDQISRLERGQVQSDQFDYEYLHFRGLRFGQDALEQLRSEGAGTNPALVSSTAAQTLKKIIRPAKNANPNPPVAPAEMWHVWPTGSTLPESFVDQDWNDQPPSVDLPDCLRYLSEPCDLYLSPTALAGKHPVLLVVGQSPHGGSALLQENAAGTWELVGTLPSAAAGCLALRQRLQAGGAWRLRKTQQQALQIGALALPLSTPAEMPVECHDPLQKNQP